MNIEDKQFEIYLNASEIQQRIGEIGKQISEDYYDHPPLFIAVLNGAFMFASDLFKSISIQAQISFVKLASYNNTNSTKDVKKLLGINETITSRDIIILEDIVDTGNTMVELVKMINSQDPNSLEIATLLYKPDALKHDDFQLKYVGFEIPNKFVVGFGLDYNGIGRHYKDIYQIV